MWLTVIIIIISLFFGWMKWNYTYFKRNNVKGPAPSLIVGNVGEALSMKLSLGQLAHRWYEKYSDQPYIGYYRCFTNALLVRDPDIIKDVLIKDFSSFHANDVNISQKHDQLIAQNPFFVSDEIEWKKARGILSPLFTSGKVKAIYPIMEAPLDNLTNFVRKRGKNYDFVAKELAVRFTTENVFKSAFSLDAKCFEDGEKSEFLTIGQNIFQTSTSFAIKSLIVTFFPSLVDYLSFTFLSFDLEKWFQRLYYNNVESREGLKTPLNDLMDGLLALKKQHNLTHERVIGQALSFYIEGFETSSGVLSFALYELGKNQDIQQTLFDEITEVLSQHDGKIPYDALQKMQYLDGIVFETLRLYPVAFTMNKLSTKSYKLPPVPGQNKSFEIKSGTPIMIPIYSLNRDSKYFPEPEVFDPLRHTEEERQKRHKTVFLPFGEGPRMCMGMKFGLTQVKAAICSIVQNFNIQISPNCPPFEVDVKAFLYVAKNPLLLNFEPRK